MRTLAPIALAVMFAATGTVSTASAALSDRDSPVWRMTDDIQVAKRGGGDRGGRNDGGRADRSRNDGRSSNLDRARKDEVIKRKRGKKQEPSFLFGRDHDRDCVMSNKAKTNSVNRCD